MTGRRTWIMPAVAGVLMLVAALAWGIPWLTKSREDRTSTPTPPPFATITPIVLEPGEQACENLVALSPDTRQVTVLSARFEGKGPRLQVVATAPGYRGTGEIAAGYEPLMPSFAGRVSEEDVFALVAYIKSLAGREPLR